MDCIYRVRETISEIPNGRYFDTLDQVIWFIQAEVSPIYLDRELRLEVTDASLAAVLQDRERVELFDDESLSTIQGWAYQIDKVQVQPRAGDRRRLQDRS